jgi:hypothetical protein
MSRKLGVFVLVLGILVGSMGLKTALSNGHQNGTVMTANGPDIPPPPPKKTA